MTTFIYIILKRGWEDGDTTTALSNLETIRDGKRKCMGDMFVDDLIEDKWSHHDQCHGIAKLWKTL